MYILHTQLVAEFHHLRLTLGRQGRQVVSAVGLFLLSKEEELLFLLFFREIKCMKIYPISGQIGIAKVGVGVCECLQEYSAVTFLLC